MLRKFMASLLRWCFAPLRKALMVGDSLPAIHIPLPTFDLEKIRRAVIADSRRYHKVELTEKESQTLVEMYRKFLAACKEYPDSIFNPTPGVDLIWHRHALDMDAYERDCLEYFG